MHPLRVLLFVSLGLAAAVAVAFGMVVERSGGPLPAAVAAGLAVFAIFLVPWSGVFAWALRRAGDLDLLTSRTRRLTAGALDESIGDRSYHGELDDLARTIEEIRLLLQRQQASSREQRALTAEIVASLGESLIAMNARGKIVFANAQASKLFGYTGEITGQSVLAAVRKPSVHGAFDRALAGHATVERFMVSRGDDERQIEMRAFPVRSSTEVAAVAIFLDVTTMERLQRVRSDFLDDFSHEVRTPLAGLRSAVETFEAGGLTAPQEEQLRAVMLRQLTRIERLVSDLSELNRIESGELQMERSLVDLQAMLAELCDEFRNRFAGEGIEILLEGVPVHAEVDVRIQQVFANILDNAWKHGRRGGPIHVETSSSAGVAVVRISDEGEGIPPSETERIFNRFYRVDKSRSQHVPGVGLGLAIAKHLVLAHGGSIRACNRPGGGAMFEVSIPIDA